MDKRIKLTNLNPEEVIHPLEKSAIINIINKIPGGKSTLNGLGELYGKFVAVDYYGNGVIAGPDNMPTFYRQYRKTCDIIGLTDIPEIATEWAYIISAFTVGGAKKRIVMSSGAIDLLETDEIQFLLGEELGNIITGHLPFHMLLELLYSSALEIHPFKEIAGIIRMPLLDWFRKSHYTNDRVALLCCQDIDAALRTMMKLAGLPRKYYGTLDSKIFLRQAENFEDINNNGWAKDMMMNYLLRSSSLPWMVDRAKQLLEWYNSGAYQAILDRG